MLRWLFYQLPEAFLVFYTGFRLLGVGAPPRRFWPAVLILAVSVPAARALPLPFGFHTVILFGVYVILGIVFVRVSVQTAVIAGAVAFFLLSLGSSLMLTHLLAARKIAIADLIASEPGYFVAAYLSASLLIVVTLLTAFFRFRLFNAPEATEENSRPSADRQA